MSETDFSCLLISWFKKHKRDLPWRQERSVYKTWVCEIMSQQTTLKVVVPKFLTFIKILPNLEALSQCHEEKMRVLWSGLGYYARARNLIKGAQYIVQELNSKYPETYHDWRKVHGCGSYSAALIASVCYGDPEPAIDGNVMRVVSRLLELTTDVWSSHGQKLIYNFIKSHIPDVLPGEFNEALIELGATVCTKTKPRCPICPLSSYCQSYKNKTTHICPPPKPRKKPVEKSIIALLLYNEEEKSFLILKRNHKWLKNTVGFMLFDDNDYFKKLKSKLIQFGRFYNQGKFLKVSHVITHHKLEVSSYVLRTQDRDMFMKARNCIENLGHYEIIDVSRLKTKLSTSLDCKLFENLLLNSTIF